MEFSKLIGKTFTNCFRKESSRGQDEIFFVVDDKTSYKLTHIQECGESVYIEDIDGCLSDLVGTEILEADEVSNSETVSEFSSQTWTFYKLATIKGYVTIRWYGCSNGYYSESASLVEVSEKNN
jgi:hypothetical protein